MLLKLEFLGSKPEKRSRLGRGRLEEQAILLLLWLSSLFMMTLSLTLDLLSTNSRHAWRMWKL